jgi:hypothetical protein
MVHNIITVEKALHTIEHNRPSEQHTEQQSTDSRQSQHRHRRVRQSKQHEKKESKILHTGGRKLHRSRISL